MTRSEQGAKTIDLGEPHVALNPLVDLMAIEDVAALIKVRPATIRSYVTRGRMPRPDGYFAKKPWWRAETIRAWQASRPGKAGRPSKEEK